MDPSVQSPEMPVLYRLNHQRRASQVMLRALVPLVFLGSHLVTTR